MTFTQADLQSFEQQSDDHPGNDQQVPDDGCRAWAAEEITEKESQHHFSVTPQEERENEHQAISLCEHAYLEEQREDKYLDGHWHVEQEVEGVSDEPVGPATEAVLLHHSEVLLKLVLHQHRHEHLHTPSHPPNKLRNLPINTQLNNPPNKKIIHILATRGERGRGGEGGRERRGGTDSQG